LSIGELIGAYQSVKLEMAMIGLLLVVTELVFIRPVLAAALAALIINFKWFPIAPIGLLALSRLRQGKLRFTLALPLFLLLIFLLAVFVYGWAFASELYRTQHLTLVQFVSSAFGEFPSFFGMLKHTFGLVLSKSSISIAMATVAAALGALVLLAPY